MRELYNNKYRIPSNRLPGWDYGQNAPYFVTICTSNRIHYFGEISDNQMNLSLLGEIAHSYWQEIPLHFPFIILDDFIIMPNHVHGILIINKPAVETQDFASLLRTPLVHNLKIWHLLSEDIKQV